VAWISLDGRHFGLIATNFEHHGSNSSPVGIIRGLRMMWLVICAVALAARLGCAQPLCSSSPIKAASQRSSHAVLLLTAANLALTRNEREGVIVAPSGRGHFLKQTFSSQDFFLRRVAASSSKACGRAERCQDFSGHPEACSLCSAVLSPIGRGAIPSVKQLVQAPPQERGPCHRYNRTETKD
jgi:hypothetical protein